MVTQQVFEVVVGDSKQVFDGSVSRLCSNNKLVSHSFSTTAGQSGPEGKFCYGCSIPSTEESFMLVLEFEFKLVVRTGDDMGSMYSPSISSSYNMDKMKSSFLDFFNISMKAIISSRFF